MWLKINTLQGFHSSVVDIKKECRVTACSLRHYTMVPLKYLDPIM